MDQLVKTEALGSIAVITMNNPKGLNQLSLAMMTELERAFVWAKDARDIEEVILEGGEVFSAGARIQELHEVAKTGDREKIRKFIADANRMANLLEDIGKPTTAVISKYCFGGGNELAMAAQCRSATIATLFGQQEIKHGIMPGMGATQRLPRLVGITAAMPILLGGETFTAEHALKIGLTGDRQPHYSESRQDTVPAEIVNDEMELFLESAIYSDIVEKTEFPKACLAIIRAVREGLKQPLRGGLRIEQELFVEIMMTDQAQNGLQRTIDKLTRKNKD